jgi:undecaprenyl-diphosphatase
MSYLDAILLGIVQGVAEFLPISSDGHLVVMEHILGLTGSESNGESPDLLAVNIALHFGSLLAILVVFRKDLLPVLRDFKLMTAIIVATLPLVPVGLLLKDSEWLNSQLLAGFGFCVTAVLLLVSQRFEPRAAPPAPRPDGAATNAPSQVINVPWPQALIVGLFQCVAIAPGVSRSGSTIVAGLMQGFPRDVAAKFAFLIAIPALLGANVLKAKDLFEGETGADLGPIAVGTLVSFIVGVACLKLLLRLITQRRLHWFGWYCAVVGVIVIAVTLLQD